MLLVVDAVMNQVHCPNIMRYAEDYEDAFELVNEMVRQGFQLLSARVEDKDSQLKIPVEAFDGQPVEVHLRALQAQWHQLLAAPQGVASNVDSLKEWLMRLDAYYEASLIHLEKMIFLLQIRKLKIQGVPDLKQRDRFDPRVDALLEINHRMHRQTLESYHQNQKRISRLDKSDTVS